MKKFNGKKWAKDFSPSELRQIANERPGKQFGATWFSHPPRVRKAATAALEQFGPRNMPLIRSNHLSDAQWEAAKKEYIAVMRRTGRNAAWLRKHAPSCPQCGSEKGPFGSCSGLCKKCGKTSRRETEAWLRSL
jgi:hypothetical protein